MEERNETYLLVELRKEHLDLAQHAAHRAVARKVRLRPDVPVHAVLLLLVLQVEGGDGRVVVALLRHVAHATLRSVHDAREGLTDDGVVRLLAAVRLVVPARQVPLQQQHETLVRVIALETRDERGDEIQLRRIQQVDVHQHVTKMLQQRTRRQEEHGDQYACKVLSLE